MCRIAKTLANIRKKNIIILVKNQVKTKHYIIKKNHKISLTNLF